MALSIESNGSTLLTMIMTIIVTDVITGERVDGVDSAEKVLEFLLCRHEYNVMHAGANAVSWGQVLLQTL